MTRQEQELDDAVAARAWGVPDARVVDALAAENTPGSRHRGRGQPVSLQRERAVAERARVAGWPTDVVSLDVLRRHHRQTLERIGVWGDWRDVNRPMVRRHGPTAAEDTGDPVTIFDE